MLINVKKVLTKLMINTKGVKMTESRRKSDTGYGELDLGTPTSPIPSNDPIETRYSALFNQHLKNINSQIDMRAENAVLRAENEQLRADVNTLYKKAYFDKLTGLPNQRLLEDSFQEAVKRDDNIVLLFIDLNKFKQINDTYGHDVGDEALKLASNKLVSLTRSTDIVALISEEKEDPQTHLPVRYAGDEFIILFTGATLADLQRKIQDVKNTFATLSFKSDDQEIPVGASIGAYEYKKGDTLEHCKKEADKAMYADKRASRLDGTSLVFGRMAAPYLLPAATGYIPTTTGYQLPSTYTGPKIEPA